jgi:hypothetical protein
LTTQPGKPLADKRKQIKRNQVRIDLCVFDHFRPLKHGVLAAASNSRFLFLFDLAENASLAGK